MLHSFYILSTGTELTTGRSKDSNATHIARIINESGFGVIGLGTLPDDPDILYEELERILQNPRVTGVIMTGGMGPTEDDHTVDVLKRLTGLSEMEDQSSLQKLKSRARDLPDRIQIDIARRQVRILEGSVALPNERGLAPGILVTYKRKGQPDAVIAAMSGFPQEMHPILTESLIPELIHRFPGSIAKRKTFYIYGVGESSFQTNFFGTDRKSHAIVPSDRTAGLAGKLPDDFRWGISAGEGRIRVFFESSDEGELERLFRLAVEYYGERLLSSSVQELIHEVCQNRSLKIGAAESCTGGLIGKTLTDRSGSSAYFMGSIVTYSNEAKMNLLGIPEKTLVEHGAVSEPVAGLMAEGALKSLQADFTVGITGIAGPEGGSKEKPVGTVFISCAGKNRKTSVTRIYYPLDRDRIREFTTGLALYHLYRFITSSSPS